MTTADRGQATSSDRPLVSVVIPTYNGGSTFAETLRCVLAQTYPRCELLVVDNGSTDGTPQVAASIAPGACILHCQRRGVSAARNLGLAQATGEFVCFLDQDDLWFPEHLARHVDALVRYPHYGVVFGPYRHWYPQRPSDNPWGALLPARPQALIDDRMQGWIYHEFLADCLALTSATTMRRALLPAQGAFDEAREFAEDWDLWLRLSRVTQFARLTWPPVLYRQHASQGSRLVRATDYRTLLLDAAAARYGLSSPDGNSMPRATFRRHMAHYQMAFGRVHLQHGQRWTGVQSLWAAWRRDPRRIRYLALAVAGMAGYRPAPDHTRHDDDH